jgi:hypothetical protein
MLGSTKNIGGYKDTIFSTSYKVGDDLFLRKSIYTYFLVKKDTDQRTVKDYITKMQNDGIYDSSNKTFGEIQKRYLASK